MADLSEAWFWALNLGAAVIGGGWFAFRWMHVARVIEDTPTSRVRSAAQGYVELEGRARPLAGTMNLAPMTQRDCVWWRYRVQHRSESAGRGGRRELWRTVASGRSGQPFLIDDGTGECIVQPADAEVLAAESTTWYGATPWPTSAPGKAGLRIDGRDYRYLEERIHVHEQVYALGSFRSVSGTGNGVTEDAVRALLAEWKQDQDALGRRFDRKGGDTAFRNMLAALQDNWSMALTADIPKVSRVAGLGIVKLAQLSGRPIYPVAVATSRRITFASWDRTAINLPFSRGAIVAGPPIRVPADVAADELERARLTVETSLNEATERAYAIVDRRSRDDG